MSQVEESRHPVMREKLLLLLGLLAKPLYKLQLNFTSNSPALIKTRNRRITKLIMVATFIQQLPQITLTDYDADNEQVLFSVKTVKTATNTKGRH